MFFSKKPSAVRSFTNALGITKPEPTGWERFKSSAGQFWEADKASVSAWSEKDHHRRLELVRAKNTINVGLAWPVQAKAEGPSAVGAALNWALENPEKVVVAAAAAAAAGKWVAARWGSGAPEGEPEAE